MLVEKTLAHHQAGARRQGQAYAALIDAELDPARTRVAHAQDIDLGVFQAQPYRIALQRADSRRNQAAEESGHGYSIAPAVTGA
ncbi:hypothetical protein QT383_15610 [Stenotrophomonas rhizophila]